MSILKFSNPFVKIVRNVKSPYRDPSFRIIESVPSPVKRDERKLEYTESKNVSEIQEKFRIVLTFTNKVF